jgi:adenylate kinase family enzyme
LASHSGERRRQFDAQGIEQDFSSVTNLRSPRKILVIGSGGAGKSTFARRLNEILGIAVVHLDALYWRPGWVEPSKAEWAETVSDVLKRDAWIMDGNYSGTLAERIDACDVVIFLDVPRTTCLWRVIRRRAMYRNATRPDMAEGCREHLSLEFFAWIWNYPKRSRPKVVKLLGEERTKEKVVWLRTPAETDRFLLEYTIALATKQSSFI